MYDLFDIIRSRVFAQSLHLPLKGTYPRTRQEILSRSLWVYSDHDFQSRISNQVRSPKKRLLHDGALSIPIYGVQRLISKLTFKLLLSGFKKELEMDQVIKLIKNEGSTTLLHVSNILNLTSKTIEKSVNKALKSWNVIKYKGKLYYWEEFLREIELIPYFQSNDSEINEDTILTILDSYPNLTVNQIAMLSGYSKTQIENYIYEIVLNNRVTKGIMRKNSNEEYYNCTQINQIFDVNWEETSSFVLEKRDALVEVIKLEQHFEFSDVNYWFFLDGIPQAQFNLIRKGRSNQYLVSGFNRLLKNKRDLADIELKIKEWGKKQNISLSIDFTDSPYAILTKKIVNFLEKRGYVFQNGGLNLQLDSKQSSSYNPFSMKKLGRWYLDKQLFNTPLSTDEILHELIQFDDINSILVRLPEDASSIDFSNIIYTVGLNYRLGFIHKEILPIIIKGWPRETRYNSVDRQILQLLKSESYSTSQILTLIDQPRNKVQARIRYLEQMRSIHRDLSLGFNSNSQTWKILSIDDNYSTIKSLVDIGKIIKLILSTNPPLTIDQLSRLLGISFSEINQIKNDLIKAGQVIEGYFFDLYQEIQLSTPQVINDIQEIMDSSEERDEIDDLVGPEIQLVPQSDPLAILHLSNLILGNKSLEIKSRIDPSSEIWMVMWNSLPSGYILKIPSQESLIDFNIEIRVISELNKISVLSLIIDNLAFLSQFWNNCQLYLIAINESPVTERKFERLHFILDTVGIRY